MKAAKKGFYNMFYGVAWQLIMIGFSLVTPILVIENYGSEVNGLLHSAAQIFTYLSLLEAGVGSATLQALYAPVAKGDRQEVSAIMAATHKYYVKTGLFYSIGVTLFACLYPVLVTSSLPYFQIVAIILFGGIGGSINYFYQGKYILLMQAEGYTYISTKINIFINIITNIVKIALLINGFDVIAVQLSYFLLQVVCALCYCVCIKRRYREIDFSIAPDYKAIEQKNAVFVHQISYLIFSSTDILLLTFLTQDLKLVSVYTLYNSIVTMLLNLIQQVSSGFDFKLGQIYSTDRAYYRKLYHVFEILHLVLVFAAMSALYPVFLPFMSRYTQHVTDIHYVNTLYPICFIMVPLLTHGRTAANSSITFAGHFEQTKRYSIIESTINLLVSMVGIRLFGLPGALLGTILASIYRTINIIWYYYHFISPGPPWKTVKRWIFCFSVFFFVVIANHFFPLPLNDYLSIFLSAIMLGGLFLCIYGIGQYLLNREERQLMRELLGKATVKLMSRMRKGVDET